MINWSSRRTAHAQEHGEHYAGSWTISAVRRSTSLRTARWAKRRCASCSSINDHSCMRYLTQLWARPRVTEWKLSHCWFYKRSTTKQKIRFWFRFRFELLIKWPIDAARWQTKTGNLNTETILTVNLIHCQWSVTTVYRFFISFASVYHLLTKLNFALRTTEFSNFGETTILKTCAFVPTFNSIQR